MQMRYRTACAIGLMTLAGACATPDPLATISLAKGEQIAVRTLVAQNPGARGCIDYDAASNSCASLTRTRISGNTLIGEEITAVANPVTGKTARIVVATRARIVGKDACIKSSGIKAGAGTEDRELTDFAVGFTKDLINEAGEVCSSYFQAGDGYVLSSRGADGQPFPPGDTAFRILTGPVSLRLQGGG